LKRSDAAGSIILCGRFAEISFNATLGHYPSWYSAICALIALAGLIGMCIVVVFHRQKALALDVADSAESHAPLVPKLIGVPHPSHDIGSKGAARDSVELPGVKFPLRVGWKSDPRRLAWQQALSDIHSAEVSVWRLAGKKFSHENNGRIASDP
jgi:hypothetical protein